MKLLMVPDPTAPKGIDAFCREVMKRATRRGHSVTVQAVPNGPLEATVERLVATAFGAAADAVIVNSLQPAALRAARSAGKPVAVRIIESFSEASPQALAQIRALALQADLLLVPSAYLERRLRGCGLNGSIRQVPYAYDRIGAQKITLVTLRSTRAASFPLAACGPFTDATQTGTETLLAALSRLRLDWHLTFAGEGPWLPRLRDKAAQKGLSDRISFAGHLDHDAVIDLFRASKAYVDPCGIEGFPMLALHAQSEGCPVVGARAGAMEELITDGENGLLVPPGDPKALAEAIVTLSSVSGLSLKLIGGGIKTVESHSWDRTVRETLEAVETLASHAPAGKRSA